MTTEDPDPGHRRMQLTSAVYLTSVAIETIQQTIQATIISIQARTSSTLAEDVDSHRYTERMRRKLAVYVQRGELMECRRMRQMADLREHEIRNPWIGYFAPSHLPEQL